MKFNLAIIKYMGHSRSSNPVFPNWLIFGTSVALHVCMKLAKPFRLIQGVFTISAGP